MLKRPHNYFPTDVAFLLLQTQIAIKRQPKPGRAQLRAVRLNNREDQSPQMDIVRFGAESCIIKIEDLNVATPTRK